MKSIKYILLALSFTMLTACGFTEIEKLIKEMTSLVEEVDQRFAEMSDEEWTSVDQSFEGYLNKYDELKSEMTDNEKKRVNELAGRYVAIRTKRFGLDVKEWLKNFSEQFGAFWREIENTKVEDVKEFFE